jgi:hypothetical protein
MGSQKEIEGSMTITWQWATLSTQDNGAAGSLAKIWEREGVKEHESSRPNRLTPVHH